jgi:putative ABC transport system substrate-binding protein
MRRRQFITLFGGTMAAWPLAARAQQSKTPRIGVLSTQSADSRTDAFKQGLRELGYIEGQTIAIEWRFSGDRTERLADFAAELVRSDVDLIVATSSLPAHAAKSATSTIPIVFVAVSDPIEFGFVESLAHPGGNLTGLSNSNIELAGKRLEILREVLPEMSRLAVLWNPLNPVSLAALHELEGPAGTLRIALRPIEARNAFELGAAVMALTGGLAEPLYVGPDPLFLEQAQQLGDFAIRHRIATMHTNKEHAQAGGLLSYGPSFSAMYRRAASYVDKILKGTKPADLPVEQPTKFELVINVKTAKALALTIPPTLLALADEVIE